MRVLNIAEVTTASGGDGEEFSYWQRFAAAAQYGYQDYSGLYEMFGMLNQRPDFWGHFFASC